MKFRWTWLPGRTERKMLFGIGVGHISRAFRQWLVHHIPSYRSCAVEVLELFPSFPSTACVVHVMGLEKAGFAGTAG